MKNERRINEIKEVIEEACRFVARAEDYIEQLMTNKWAEYGCKESAAMKRASMDLTRALVKIRR